MAKKRNKSIPANSGKAPSFQFYYKDWLGDQRLKRASNNAKGVWIDLVCLSMDMPIPGVFADGENGQSTLKRREINDLLTGNRRKNYDGMTELIRRGILKKDESGVFYVKRIKRDMELRCIRQEAGRKGGNPILLNQSANQKPTPSTSTSASAKYSSNSTEFLLSKLLFDEIVKRKSDYRKPDLQKWAIHIDRMIRLNKRDPARIESVIRWCQQDDFWRNNILSTEKLRKQFDQLELKMGESQPPKAAPLERDADGLTPIEKLRAEQKKNERTPDYAEQTA